MNQTFGVFVHCSSCFSRHRIGSNTEQPVSTTTNSTITASNVPSSAYSVMFALMVGLVVVSFWPRRS